MFPTSASKARRKIVFPSERFQKSSYKVLLKKKAATLYRVVTVNNTFNKEILVMKRLTLTLSNGIVKLALT
jgi:hypothetical protein